jgi:uncharacterized membrane protein YdjX (TVP38/TMEM64 family)
LSRRRETTTSPPHVKQKLQKIEKKFLALAAPWISLVSRLAKPPFSGHFLAPVRRFWMIISERRVRYLLAGGAIAFAGLAVAAWYSGIEPAELKEHWRNFEQWLMLHPALLLLALVILPGFPIPSSALLLAAGIVWREHPVWACLGCVLAFTANMSWTYGVAAGPGRYLVERFLATTTLQIPELPRSNHVRLILILRLTPGMPFFIQNYVLGFLRPPFRLYLPLSMLCNAPIICGVVLSGAGLANGRLLPLIVGVGLVILTLLLTHSARCWLARRREVAS